MLPVDNHHQALSYILLNIQDKSMPEIVHSSQHQSSSYDRGTEHPQSNAKYIHIHLRKCPSIHTLGIHHREVAILFPMLRSQYIHLLDALDQQLPIKWERHPTRQCAIPPRYTREFQLFAHLLAKYISKLSYSPLISSIAAAASSIAAMALST